MNILLVVLVAVAIVVCAVAVFALVELVRILRAANCLLDDVSEHLVPLLEKVDVTLDAVNAELLRVDTIMAQVEEMSDTVSTTTNAVRGVVYRPSEALNAAGSRLRGFLGSLRSSKHVTRHSG